MCPAGIDEGLWGLQVATYRRLPSGISFGVLSTENSPISTGNRSSDDVPPARSGIVGKDGLFPRQRPSRAKANFGTTFREVPTEDIRRLGEIYKPDFDMFGYSLDDDLALIKNELKQNV
ncbi:hypothetical protein Bbelb_218400 [Branchiostoma belcheri]|nr:hypothetical protein Bbelb_218400 [Branchiostoma belcheri]